MGKKRNTLPVVKRIVTKDLGPGYSLSEPDGSWADTQYYFVRRNPRIPQAYFFRDLSTGFSQSPDVAEMTRYDKASLDAKFGDKAGSGMDVGPFKTKYIEEPVEWDAIFRATFHLDA